MQHLDSVGNNVNEVVWPILLDLSEVSETNTRKDVAELLRCHQEHVQLLGMVQTEGFGVEELEFFLVL